MGVGQAISNQRLRMVELGYTVRGGQGEDPELIHPGGSAVERLGEEYPYDARMSREECELEKYRLQVELLKFQYWGQDLDLKHVIVFEGRDAAGKGGTIKRFTEHLNPRSARAVALNKPSDREHGQWYFQRYTQHLPNGRGDRDVRPLLVQPANVERVMGFCTDQEYNTFMDQAPRFEKMLVDSGIHLTKFWFWSSLGRPFRLLSVLQRYTHRTMLHSQPASRMVADHRQCGTGSLGKPPGRRAGRL
jgi:polyphosphate kinase 2 (PPK2 family)